MHLSSRAYFACVVCLVSAVFCVQTKVSRQKCIGNVCYLLPDTMRSFSGAKQYCNTKNMEFFSILNDHDKDEVTALMYLTNIRRVFVGLKSEILKGNFTVKWAENEPNNRFGIEHCVMKNIVTGRLKDVPCSLSLHFLCKTAEVYQRVINCSSEKCSHFIRVSSKSQAKQKCASLDMEFAGYFTDKLTKRCPNARFYPCAECKRATPLSAMCADQKCYMLYKSTRYLTYDGAKNACWAIGTRLAVLDLYMQSKFVSIMKKKKISEARVAGKRSRLGYKFYNENDMLVYAEREALTRSHEYKCLKLPIIKPGLVDFCSCSKKMLYYICEIKMILLI